jgi:hypothetical protein
MRKSINLLNNEDSNSLSNDLVTISRNRTERKKTADFDSYLAFMEETSAVFGFGIKRKHYPIKADNRSFIL